MRRRFLTDAQVIRLIGVVRLSKAVGVSRRTCSHWATHDWIPHDKRLAVLSEAQRCEVPITAQRFLGRVRPKRRRR